MVGRKLSMFFVVCGALMMVFSFSLLPKPEMALASPVLEPSPRPPVPTATPKPGTGGDSQPSSAEPGRITGTVIDATTGAPVSGVTVIVGDQVVVTDQYGNYERWVTPGAYNVALVLAPERGTPDAAVQTVQVTPRETTVLHLNFHSPAPAAPLALAQPDAQPQPAAAAIAPAAMPDSLPLTSVMESTRSQPATLPRTSESPLGGFWLWLSFGAVLMTIGIIVSLVPRRRIVALIRPGNPAERELIEALFRIRK